ncbi:recombinase family protein [Mycobacterium sp.]|uniref:recombinase family protein n=1 Tax=Mycobacterium sp. TaxID=1785 RepID=UPI002BEA62BA|nr:recombinase family protein [Mycobacterium sp.]HTY35126.1 recombinase family protein [Mycobacterium sp.]
MHTALYSRVSQDATGERLAVQRQYDDCAVLADRLGWTIVEHFSDNDISAYDGSARPGFEAMLAAIKRGEVNAIICWQPDRLYRSLKDLERLVDATDRGVQIATVNGGDLDLSHSTGRMLARILGSVSRQESELKAERRRRANMQRAGLDGKGAARRPGRWRADQPRVFGYTQRGEPLEPEATAVRQAILDVLGGRSLRSIAAEWNERGLLTPRSAKRGGGRWSNLTLRRVLVRPVYAGLVVYQGKVVGRGEWQAIIDEDTHRGLVAYLSDEARRPATAFERRHMGSGVYQCGVCDGKLYATFPSAARPMLYSCKPHKHVARLAAPLDELVTEVVLGVLRRDDIASRLRPREGFDVVVMHARREALQSRMDELAAMFARGEIDASQLRSGTAEHRGRVGEIDRILAEQVRTSPTIVLLDGDPDDLENRWDALPPDMQGKVIDELATVIVKPTNGAKGVDRDGIVDLDFVDIIPKKLPGDA